MTHRTTLAGFVVLALMAAGVFYVQSRHASQNAGTPRPGSGTRPGGMAADAGLPDATMAEAAVEAGHTTFRVVIQPNPPVAFAKILVRVRAEVAGALMPIADGSLDFDMAMPMGDHTYTIVPGADGWYDATVTLPQCVTGDQRWYGTIEGIVAGEKRRARFRFDLARLE